MDEWLFISLAKVKADAPGFQPPEPHAAERPREEAGRKANTALALDYELLEEKPRFRGAVALAAAALLTGAFLGAIEGTTLSARTPAGEVIVADLESEPAQTAYARVHSADDTRAPL